MIEWIGIGMLAFGLFGMAVSVLLAFVWKIPDVMDELSGRKAKRQIQGLKDLNIGSGGMDGFSTNELYELLNSSGTLLWTRLGSSGSVSEDPIVDQRPVDAGISERESNSDLHKMSDDGDLFENGVSGNGEVHNVSRNFREVLVLEEQTSLSAEDMK